MPENSNLWRDININIQENQQMTSKMNSKETHTETYYPHTFKKDKKRILKAPK